MNGELDHVALTIAESALDGLLQRVLIASGDRTRQRYTLKYAGFSQVDARLSLQSCRLRARAADGGALRLEVAARADFRFGLGYPDRRIDLSCAVLATPELRRAEQAGLALRVDFAEATLRSLRVEQRSRGGMLGFDPTAFDPFADDRLRELARIALRVALRRLGEWRTEGSAAAIDALVAALPESSGLAVDVRDREIEVRTESEHSDAEPIAVDPLKTGAARLTLDDPILTRLLESQLTARGSDSRWRVRAPRVRTHRAGIDVELEVAPLARFWPRAWRLHGRARLSPRLSGDTVTLRLEGLEAIRPRVPGWLGRALVPRLAERLAGRSWPRSHRFRIPFSQDEHARLEVTALEPRNGGLDVFVESDA